MLDANLSADVALVASAERKRLADAARHLIDVLLTAEDLSAAELDRASSIVEELNASLDGRAPEAAPHGVRSRFEATHTDYLPRSPLIGAINPMSPPFTTEWKNGRLYVRGAFGAAHEGPPGYVHGGWLALAFDEIFGMTAIAAEHPGMTGKLSIRYLRPTPLRVPLVFEGWLDRVEGRRIIIRGTVSANGEITGEGEALFIQIPAERALEYFGPRADGTPRPQDA